MENWQEKVSEVFTADLHCDSLFAVKKGSSLANGRKKGHFDLPRMQSGCISCQVLSIFVHPRWIPKHLWWRKVEKQIAILHQALDAAPESWTLAKSPQEVSENRENGVKSLVLEIEGLHPLESNTGKLDELWEIGVRIYTLTWNNSNRFAHSASDDQNAGLTEDGKAIVKEIIQRGGIIDLSHSSDRTFYDILDMDIAPLLSHSCLRSIKNSSRNATDDMVRKLGETGGIIGINFFPGFLSTKSYKKVTSENLVEHIEMAIELGGENIAALGSDFDGVQALPDDIPDAASFWRIAETMNSHGISGNTISKVMGKNFLNFWIARSE